HHAHLRGVRRGRSPAHRPSGRRRVLRARHGGARLFRPGPSDRPVRADLARGAAHGCAARGRTAPHVRRAHVRPPHPGAAGASVTSPAAAEGAPSRSTTTLRVAGAAVLLCGLAGASFILLHPSGWTINRLNVEIWSW